MIAAGEVCDRHPSAAALTWWWLLPAPGGPLLDVPAPSTATVREPCAELTLCGHCGTRHTLALIAAGFTLARDLRPALLARVAAP